MKPKVQQSYRTRIEMNCRQKKSDSDLEWKIGENKVIFNFNLQEAQI